MLGGKAITTTSSAAPILITSGLYVKCVHLTVKPMALLMVQIQESDGKTNQ